MTDDRSFRRPDKRTHVSPTPPPPHDAKQPRCGRSI